MRKNKLKAAIIGKDARTNAIERCLEKSNRIQTPIGKLSDWKNEKAGAAKENVLRKAQELKPDFVIVGPEEPLAEGIVDEIQEKLGIPCIGPTRELAQLEASKAFTRSLLSKHRIQGNPEYRVFHNLEGVEEYAKELGGYVIKPDGLTGGKGVKISDVHLFSVQNGVDYCKELLSHGHPAVVIEEKLDGEEFSLQSFCDGTNVVDMVLVQDHKRAYEGDIGPNTGGMGSYSCENHSLPFLLPRHVQEASAINRAVAQALLAETGQKYKGILYGGFMVTRAGVRLLEYNARFGDPETLNVLSLLKTDFVDICEAIIQGSLGEQSVEFERKATVCKYIVPDGYPDNPVKGERIDLSGVPKQSDQLKIYHAAVEEKSGELYLSGSRAVAFVGIGKNLSHAQSVAEEAASAVKGPVFHRRDIGTTELIQHRIAHMQSLLAEEDFRELLRNHY